eukprot:scaffold620_cov386-Prasinococcus_capsulatus_cf.AAC.9
MPALYRRGQGHRWAVTSQRKCAARELGRVRLELRPAPQACQCFWRAPGLNRRPMRGPKGAPDRPSEAPKWPKRSLQEGPWGPRGAGTWRSAAERGPRLTKTHAFPRRGRLSGPRMQRPSARRSARGAHSYDPPSVHLPNNSSHSHCCRAPRRRWRPRRLRRFAARRRMHEGASCSSRSAAGRRRSRGRGPACDNDNDDDDNDGGGGGGGGGGDANDDDDDDDGRRAPPSPRSAPVQLPRGRAPSACAAAARVAVERLMKMMMLGGRGARAAVACRAWVRT